MSSATVVGYFTSADLSLNKKYVVSYSTFSRGQRTLPPKSCFGEVFVSTGCDEEERLVGSGLMDEKQESTQSCRVKNGSSANGPDTWFQTSPPVDGELRKELKALGESTHSKNMKKRKFRGSSSSVEDGILTAPRASRTKRPATNVCGPVPQSESQMGPPAGKKTRLNNSYAPPAGCWSHRSDRCIPQKTEIRENARLEKKLEEKLSAKNNVALPFEIRWRRRVELELKLFKGSRRTNSTRDNWAVVDGISSGSMVQADDTHNSLQTKFHRLFQVERAKT
ncbi:hypothetical protein C8R44DRAFT_737779 [Mycena epipterygia]|nr:hypothetical protein C8R44DRAFT_737779 [Mycena epipterygia]